MDLPRTDAEWSQSSKFLDVFPKVALPMVLALSDQSIVATALPEIAGMLGSVQQISLVVIGYLIAATIAAPVYGRLGDLWGRRKLLIGALALFMVSSICCAFAPNMTLLIIGRVVQGFGGGGLMALSQAVIGESVAPRDRARYQGYLAGVGVTSNAMGPILGGFLTEYFGWRSIFLWSIPLGLLAIFLVSRLPQRTSAPEKFRFDYVGLLLFTCFVVSVLVLLDLVQRFAQDQALLMAVLLSVAVVSLLVLVAVERRIRSPLLPLDLLRNSVIWRANAMAACHGGILVSLLTFIPLYLRVMHGLSPGEIGLLLVPMTVCIGIGSICTGQIVSRTGRTAIFPSVGMCVVTVVLVAVALLAPSIAPNLLSLVLGLMALFLGTVMSVVQVTVQTAAGKARIGAAAAAVQYSRSMGAAFGTASAAAVLFGTLIFLEPTIGPIFAEALQGGEAKAVGDVQATFGTAFSAAFLLISALSALGAALAWSLPLRRI